MVGLREVFGEWDGGPKLHLEGGVTLSYGSKGQEALAKGKELLCRVSHWFPEPGPGWWAKQTRADLKRSENSSGAAVGCFPVL